MKFVAIPPAWLAIVRIVADYDDVELAEMLSAREQAELELLRAESRRRERVASRIAAKSMALERGVVTRADQIRFEKSEARPIVFIEGIEAAVCVSFSHTAGIGAAALHDAAVGLDLEHERVIDLRATKFFLRDDELASARASLVGNALLHWWCAKEAAFKMWPDSPTLLRVPLELEHETAAGLVLRGPRGSRVETARLAGDLVAALAIGSDAASRPSR